MRRTVLTSSSRAVCTPTPGEAMKVGVETWNSEAVAARGMLGVHGQQDAAGAGGGGAWMQERGAEAGFALNAILPATCMGPVLAPQAQPCPGTAGFVRQLFGGTDLVAFQWLQPQWFVDVRDAAALHVAGLVLEGERVFGWASRMRGRGLLRLWRSCSLGARLRSWRIRGRI